MLQKKIKVSWVDLGPMINLFSLSVFPSLSLLLQCCGWAQNLAHSQHMLSRWAEPPDPGSISELHDFLSNVVCAFWRETAHSCHQSLRAGYVLTKIRNSWTRWVERFSLALTFWSVISSCSLQYPHALPLTSAPGPKGPSSSGSAISSSHKHTPPLVQTPLITAEWLCYFSCFLKPTSVDSVFCSWKLFKVTFVT